MNLLRLIDANANRAREAMRVMEDAARFILDDAPLAERAKQLRHDLAAALKPLPDLALHRDTPGDVGTSITSATENQRDDVGHVVTAAGNRLSEALRCVEEYAKTIDPKIGAAVEQMRYRGYELQTQLTRRVRLPDPRQWRVGVIVTEALCEHHTWLDVAKASLAAGAQYIQLREKNIETLELYDRAHTLVDLAKSFTRTNSPRTGSAAGVEQTTPRSERGAAERRPGSPPHLPGPAIIINDRLDVALAAGAHGVHLGQHDLSPEAARRIAGRSLLVGASTHNLREAKRVFSGGAKVDYCGVGAMYPTTTKARRPSGPDYLRRFVRDFPGVAHLAIGGVSPDNIDELVRAGARAVAVSACVCGARRPDRVVRQLLAALPS